MIHPGDIQATLAEFASALTWPDVPPEVQIRVEELLLDALANAIAGRSADGSARIETTLRALDGSGASSVVGSSDGLSLLGAVAQNAYQITAYTMCDVYRPALCHVTPEVVPAVLAVAERTSAIGTDVLAALAAGIEVTVRLGRGLGYPAFRGRGFHTPGVIGNFGAAAAAGRLFGLDADAMSRAFGISGSQAAGTFAALGTEAIKFHQMHGARSGVIAAIFAQHGATDSTDMLTAHDGGLLTAYSDGGSPDAIVEGLGSDWELGQITLRPRPGSSSVQSVAQCTIALLAAIGNRPLSTIRSARVVVPESAYLMCEGISWSDQLGALQSARYVVAALLAGGRWWTELFDEAHRSDPHVSSFAAEHVEVVPESSMVVGGARVSVELDDGRVFEEQTAFAKGDPEDPMCRGDILDKLELTCGSSRQSGRAFKIIDAVERLSEGHNTLTHSLLGPSMPAIQR